MKTQYPFHMWLMFSLFLFSVNSLFSQTTINGKVTDAESGEILIGATVYQKDGNGDGVYTDLKGQFELELLGELPQTIIVSYTGYDSYEVIVNDANQELEVRVNGKSLLIPEVVVSASRFKESYMEAPVTVEQLDILKIKQGSSFDFYDELSKLKGIQSTPNSITFNSLNARGFTSAGNTRIVQLMDGMENAAPILNFPLGNAVGMSELDAQSVEVLPGAASALYGPNAFHGIILMNSKDPFAYQGLSAQVKSGITRSEATSGVEPLNSVAFRYAKAFNDKLAFKVNFSALYATDWVANDYETTRINYERQVPPSPNFDGQNLYGDETQIVLGENDINDLASLFSQMASEQTGLPFEAIFPLAQPIMAGVGPLTRTGFREEDLLDNNDAKSVKGNASLHYKIKDNLRASYLYQYGSGSTVYHGTNRFVIRDFTQQFHKLELTGDNFFVRGYTTVTDDGDSYNLDAVGGFANEIFSSSGSEWVPTYYLTYANELANVLLGGGEISETDVAAAHQTARAAADSNVPAVGSEEFNSVIEGLRERNLSDPNAGAAFVDESKLWHAEFGYEFSDALNLPFELHWGGNFRRYDLFTAGTILNEDPDGDGVNERISIDEYGSYLQAVKRFYDNRLRLNASLRLDKNENFDAQFSPRLSLGYTMGAKRNHHFRGSFQTAFRSPDTQAQYLFFNSGSIEVGGTEENASRYGLYNGGAYTFDSYRQFLETGNSDDLQIVDMDYVQPEKLTAFELGYKSLIDNRLMIDASGFFNIFNDFIVQQNVASREATTHQGRELPALTVFRPYTNADETIYGVGAILGWNYRVVGDFEFDGYYSWADSWQDEDAIFKPGFNAPAHAFNLGLSNRSLFKNLGASVNYRWQDEFDRPTSTGVFTIESFGSLDAQLSYRLPKIKTTIKLGGTNLLGKDYRTLPGGVFVGSLYYVSITYDQF